LKRSSLLQGHPSWDAGLVQGSTANHRGLLGRGVAGGQELAGGGHGRRGGISARRSGVCLRARSVAHLQLTANT